MYLQEAHPTDGRQAKKNVADHVLYRRHRTIDERAQVVQSCALNLELTIPVLVDDMDNTTDEAYGAVPERLYLIGTDGRVAYRGGVGPHFLTWTIGKKRYSPTWITSTRAAAVKNDRGNFFSRHRLTVS